MIITSGELLELLIQTEDNLGQNKNEFLCVCVCAMQVLPVQLLVIQNRLLWLLMLLIVTLHFRCLNRVVVLCLNFAQCCTKHLFNVMFINYMFVVCALQFCSALLLLIKLNNKFINSMTLDKTKNGAHILITNLKLQPIVL